MRQQPVRADWREPIDLSLLVLALHQRACTARKAEVAGDIEQSVGVRRG